MKKLNYGDGEVMKCILSEDSDMEKFHYETRICVQTPWDLLWVVLRIFYLGGRVCESVCGSLVGLL